MENQVLTQEVYISALLRVVQAARRVLASDFPHGPLSELADAVCDFDNLQPQGSDAT